MPDHRCIYILAAGLLAGILLGPQALGRFAPSLYDRWFLTVEQVQVEAQLAALAQQKVEGMSLDEYRARHDRELTRLQSRLSAATRHRARLPWLALALAAVFVAETILAHRPVPHARLALARYALLALILALILAQPGLLRFPI